MDDVARREIQSRFKAFQGELWRPLHADPPSLLYHYSSPAGIRGILETHELWVSDVQRLNDKQEGVYALDIFGPLLRRKSVSEPIKYLFQRELHRLGEIWFAYVASFCAARDLESQWKDYGADGTGCAVVIDLERLLGMSNGGRTFALVKMLYEEAVQRIKAEATVDHAIRLQRDMEIGNRDRKEFWMEALIYSLLPCSVRFKAPKWSSEQEWRVLMIRANRDNTRERELLDGNHTHYLTVPLNGTMIKGVLLGPRCIYSEEEMRRMLGANRLPDVPVETSGFQQL